MESILDFSKPVDIPLLEKVVSTLFTPGADQVTRSKADQVLTSFKTNENSWQQAGVILQTSKDNNTRYFALQVLEDAIKFRWKVLPQEQREGIRNYVVGELIKITSVDGYNKDPHQRMFVNKLNVILVQLLKQEWPHNWPNFIPEIVASSSNNEILCENNMNVLRLLSEETFDFSKEEMVSDKVAALKQQFNTEFRQIFELCTMVLEKSSRPSLIVVTLKTLLRFLAWIPLGYIFETQLINQLLTKFLPEPQFRNATLECLTEIAYLENAQANSLFEQMYNGVMNIILVQIPPSTDIAQAYDNADMNGNDRDTNFIRGLALFLSSFMSKHLDILEKPQNHNNLLNGLLYLSGISMVNDKEIFKVCIEFWNRFSKDLYDSDKRNINNGGGFGVLNLNNNIGGGNHERKKLYDQNNLLRRVRTVLISTMAKPEEVLVVESEEGDIIRETTKDTDAIALYKMMRDTLVYLTHLDFEDSENIMLEKLAEQCDENSQKFTWNNLNTLCWAIGSISGSMREDVEKRFLVTVIKDLLSLCELKKGKDNKAVVASNIMYVVGQYPRFLKAHWKFLKTVVNKLFEFMHELHVGVQDMACDTFLKISQKCRSQFVQLHQSERQPFINDLLISFQGIVNDLQPHQIHVFYEAVGYMVKEEKNENLRNQLLDKMMEPTSIQWRELMQVGTQNSQALNELQHVKTLLNIMRVHVSVCNSMGYSFRSHLQKIYFDMLNVYTFYSSSIIDAVRARGDVAMNFTEVKQMQKVRDEILKLLQVFVQKSEDPADIANNYCPPIIEKILHVYQNSLPAVRSPEVLNLTYILSNKLKQNMNGAMNGQLISNVLVPVFNPTLEMITKNFTDFPEHRLHFYKLIKSLNQYSFENLFNLDQTLQKHVVDSIIWAFKHTERSIAETGLEILDKLLANVEASPDNFAQVFYQNYFLGLLEDVLYVLTDRLHKSSFSMQATILKRMYSNISSGRVQVPIGQRNPQTQNLNNQMFIHQYTSNLICNAFPNTSKPGVEKFMQGLFDLDKDLTTFKVHVRDFLITIQEFSGDDNDQLFLADKEDKLRKQQQLNLEQRAAIPGLLTQKEKDEMAEL